LFTIAIGVNVDAPKNPHVDLKAGKPEAGVKLDASVTGPKVEGKGGFGIKMPKFGKGSSSSSSEDDGTGKRVKKPSVKVDANLNIAAPKSPQVDVHGGAKGELKGEVGIKGELKGPKADTHVKGNGGGGFGIKVPKFGFGHSSSSSEDDGTGKRVKKVKGGAKIDANVSVPKVEAKGPKVELAASVHSKEVDIKAGAKGPNLSVPKVAGGKEFDVKGGIDLKGSGGDLHAKGGADVGAKVDAGGKGGFGFGIKVPKFGMGSHSSSSSEDDGHGHRVKKVKAPKVDAKITVGKVDTKPEVDIKLGAKADANISVPKAGVKDDLKIGGDVHAKVDPDAGGKGGFGFGIKVPKFGMGSHSSSSSEDDGTGKRVKKVKGGAKLDANFSVPKASADVDGKGAVKVGAGVDLKTSGDLNVKGGADVGGKGFGIKMPKFGRGGDSSSSSEDDGTGKRVKKVKGGAKIDANISAPKVTAEAKGPKVGGDVKVGGDIKLGGDLKTSPSGDLKLGGDVHVKGGAEVGGKGGFGIKMPKFGFGGSSSSSEDDGTGKRVKKVKGGAKIDANISMPKGAKGPKVEGDVRIGGDAKLGGDIKVGGNLKTSPSGDLKLGGDVHGKGAEAGGKGGFGLHMPKFGFGGSSSSSEDDGTGKRVKKVKGGAKIDANISAPKVIAEAKGPKVGGDVKLGGDVKVGGDVKLGGDIKLGGDLKTSPSGDLKLGADVHVKGGAEAGGKGGVGVKMPKFGFGGSSSSSEDDGTGKRVKKVKGPKVEVDANINMPKGDLKASGGAEGKGGFGIKMPKFGKGGSHSSSSSEDEGTGKKVKKGKGDANISVPKVSGSVDVKGPNVKAAGDIKVGGDVKIGGDLKATGRADVHAKAEAGGKGGFGIKMPKFGKGGDSSSEDDGTGKKVKKVKGGVDVNVSLPKGGVDANISVPKGAVGGDVDVKGPKGGVGVSGKVDAGGKGGFGLKMPKFGGKGGDSSSSSEDDGTGKRVKKVKGGIKVDASLHAPHVGGGGKVGGDVKIGGGLKASPSADLTIKGPKLEGILL
jgi:predicted acyltransferase (DUF342 family)